MPRALSTLLPGGLIRPEGEARGPAGQDLLPQTGPALRFVCVIPQVFANTAALKTVVAGVADICKTPQTPPWVKVASKGLLF